MGLTRLTGESDGVGVAGRWSNGHVTGREAINVSGRRFQCGSSSEPPVYLVLFAVNDDVADCELMTYARVDHF